MKTRGWRLSCSAACPSGCDPSAPAASPPLRAKVNARLRPAPSRLAHDPGPSGWLSRERALLQSDVSAPGGTKHSTSEFPQLGKAPRA